MSREAWCWVVAGTVGVVAAGAAIAFLAAVGANIDMNDLHRPPGKARKW